MLSATNYWMIFAGLVFLAAGLFTYRKELGAARGVEKLVALAAVFIAVSLAVFAPEHFRGPQYVQDSVPAWMPVRWFWKYFVGCALLAAATSLTARKFQRLSSILLGLMFFLFVGMIYIPSAIANAHDRFAWAFLLRDLSFCAGAWSLAAVYNRSAAPRLSKWFAVFARAVITIAAIVYGVLEILHPAFAPGVPLETPMPSWVPFAGAWGYGAGAILLVAGIALAVNKKPQLAAGSIGALMTLLTIFPFLAMVILAFKGSPDDVSDGINNLADTLLYAGSALALSSALPRDSARAT
jgi:uncharacterized membrane protein